jgi:transcriptional regulator with XRE-family HTH domain
MPNALAYGELLGRNISAARGRRQLSQSALAARMRALGFQWQQQTVAAVEKNKRRTTTEETLGLALCLEVSMPALTAANSDEDVFITLPNGFKLGVISVERLAGRGVNDHAVQWPDGGNVPWIGALGPVPGLDPFDREMMGPAMRAQGWPEGAEVPPREPGRERGDG